VNFRGIVAAHGARAESDQRKKLRSSAKDMGIKSAFFGDFNSLCAPEPIFYVRIIQNGAKRLINRNKTHLECRKLSNFFAYTCGMWGSISNSRVLMRFV